MISRPGCTFILSYAGDLCADYGTIGWANFSWHVRALFSIPRRLRHRLLLTQKSPD